MSIKFAPKEGFAEIPDDVIDKIKELRAQQARKLTQRINELKLERANLQGTRSDYRRDQIDAELKGLKGTYESLRRTGGGNVVKGAKRGGLSDIMMRMRRLPFEKFYLKTRKAQMGEQNWIIGLTRPIISEIDSSHQGKSGSTVGPTSYDMGRYFIAVLCEAVGTQSPTFHLLPESNPSTMARHMHHHVSSGDGPHKSQNPLDWAPANCYGTFGPPIRGMFMTADIPELFRMLYLFTSTLNPSSPLLRLPHLPHIQEVKDE